MNDKLRLNPVRFGLLALALTLSLAFSLAARAAHYPDLTLHPSQSLDGDWQTIVDPYELGYYDYRWQARDQAQQPSRDAFFMDAKQANPQELLEYDFDKSPSLKVPGDWNTQKAELYYYEGSLWYRKVFERAALKKSERAFVSFGAANYRADVYLNGKKLGSHIGGFTPFSFDATEQLLPGRNSLVVRVDNKRARDAVPTLNTDWWNYGGITRSVQLVTVPQVFIQQHFLHLQSVSSGIISGEVQLSKAAAGQTVQVSIPELKLRQKVKTNAQGLAHISFKTTALQLWTPEQPKRYQINISAGSDQLSEQMGFRTIATRGKQILLNDQPIFLRGISVHEELALKGGGRATDEQADRQLLTWAKELNANFVRLAHYPHNEAMVRLAEEMGILVWSEIPVYWTIDWTNPATYANAEAQLSDMIQRDRNRANVIIWSLANETPVTPERTQFLAQLAHKARELDSSRLLSAAMERHWDAKNSSLSVVEDPLADIVDLVSFNQYIGWYDGLPDKLAQVSWKIPYNKPVFVSEFGAGAKQGLHGAADTRWTEEFQADLYRKTLSMLDNIDGLSGFSPWILVDFRSPRRVLPQIQDGFNRKGLISDAGQKKQAFYVLRDYYVQKAKAQTQTQAQTSQ